jgi:signal transduction histidine kinase
MSEPAETVELRAEPRSQMLGEAGGRAAAAAGALWLAGLAIAVNGGADGAALALLGAGTVVACFVLVPRGLALMRRHAGLLSSALLVVLGLLAIAAVSGGWLVRDWLAALVRLVPVLLVVTAACGGLVLLADAGRARLGAGGERTPWRRLTGDRATVPGSPWRAAAGLALVGLASLLGVAVLGSYAGGARAVTVVLALGIVAAALLVAGVPVVIAGLARADQTRVQAARDDERQQVAAHLHDSVLQTLALVQRQAHDPAAVARLARRQETELRAWMAGEAAPGTDTLSGALRAAVAEVEDEAGVTVEVTILGDRLLDKPGEALVAAAREALRNAVRHAGAGPIFVFAQAGPDHAEAFVRDEGAGFVLADVPTERRGVRDAIVGRMAAAGGEARVDSVPGEGTEVALRIGARG